MEEVTGLEFLSVSELDADTSERLTRLLDAANHIELSVQAATGAVVVSALCDAGLMKAPDTHLEALRDSRRMVLRAGLLLTILVDELDEAAERQQAEPEAASCRWPR